MTDYAAKLKSVVLIVLKFGGQWFCVVGFLVLCASLNELLNLFSEITCVPLFFLPPGAGILLPGGGDS
jgi:hypothetical protein